jgi:hypothetical protein
MQQMLQMARDLIIQGKMLEILRAVKRGQAICLTHADFQALANQ